MAKKEDPADLQRQKEDIENLLSSLDTAFKEGSITQEHYNEVKQKNDAKLEEITKKLKQIEKYNPPQEPEKPKEEKEPEPKKEPKKEEPPKPSKKEKEPEKEEEKKPGIVEGLASRITGEKPADEERIKEKILMEFSPKIEKINIKLVKLKAFVDALKEDKAGERENLQRITEEVGETRSSMSSVEGRLGEMEMKVEDVTETLADLKPQRFAKELQKKEEEIKLHEARLEKLDDMNSTILKRVNQIQMILEKLGNIESIAEMTKDISKKLISIDDREKKITRLADKIDNMFVEINKRLEEFMFYKAKQDSLDDLSKETMKAIDELTTKLARYAEKDDLELLRDTLENRISTLGKEGGVAGASLQSQQEKSEIESLMKLLDEQFRKGQISKKDYQKAKGANVQKLKEMGERSISYQEPVPAKAETPVVEQKLAEEPKQEEPEPPSQESGLAQAAKIAQEPTKEYKPKAEPAQAKEAAQPKAGKKEKMLSDLEYSFRKGLISQKAYESTRKILAARKI